MSKKAKIRVKGRTLTITLRSAEVAQASKDYLETILDEGVYHKIRGDDALHFFCHTLDLLRVQAGEEGTFLERMKKGEIAGVY